VRDGPSRFDVTFKLADLGLSDLTLAPQKEGEVRRRDVGSTQTFSKSLASPSTIELICSGAPEYCRDEADSFLRSTIIEAKPSKDIWSLGCVWSEAAVWSVLGREGLNEYRKDRAAATNRVQRLRSTAYSGCFHDGKKVLETVYSMHHRVREERRRNDFVVHDIITIIEDMLEEASSRPDATQIYDRFLEIFRNVQVKLKPETTGSPLEYPFPGIFQTPSDLAGRRKLPPEIPPDIDMNGLGVTFSSNVQFPTGVFENRPRSNVASPSSPMFTGIISQDNNPSGSGSKPQCTPLHVTDEPWRNSTPFPHRIQSASPVMHSSLRPMSYPLFQSTNLASASHSHTSSTPNGSPLHDERHIQHAAQSRSEDAPNPQMTHSDQALARLPKLPKVTIKEVEKWIKIPKGRRVLSPLPGHDYLEKLYGRDQVSYEHFVIYT
jgi:hypothetical protein